MVMLLILSPTSKSRSILISSLCVTAATAWRVTLSVQVNGDGNVFTCLKNFTVPESLATRLIELYSIVQVNPTSFTDKSNISQIEFWPEDWTMSSLQWRLAKSHASLIVPSLLDVMSKPVNYKFDYIMT